MTSGMQALLLSMGIYVLGFVIQILFGRLLGAWKSTLAITLSVASGSLLCVAWLGLETEGFLRWEWLQWGGNSLDLGLRLDAMAMRMSALVGFVTILVHLYSSAYLHHERNMAKYWGFLSLFAFAMLLVVAAADLMLTFIGWELMGLSSYFLIGFYNVKEDAATGSQKAFIINRMGDLGFMLAMMALFAGSGSLWLDPSSFEDLTGSTQSLLGFGLMLAAFGKSAQFPLQTWLPAAMAGPTPVSSLIHAATMVAAGVYLLVRYAAFMLPIHLDVLTVVGAMTALAAAISAWGQQDIKRVLAYSTISQLGLMLVGVGTGSGDFAMFHLFTHAIFKCGLFLSAGAVIHALHDAYHSKGLHLDAQDMRHMGGLWKSMPIVTVCFCIFSAALAGVPLFSGFLSKDGILWSSCHWAQTQGGWRWLIPVSGIAGIAITALYLGRMGALVFFGNNRSSSNHQPENGLVVPRTTWRMLVPLVVLAGMSLWVFWSPLNPFHAPENLISGHVSTPVWFPVAIGSLGILGLVVGYLLHRNGWTGSWGKAGLQGWIQSHFHWDEFLEQIGTKAVLPLGRILAWWDARIVDGLVNLIGDVVVSNNRRNTLASMGDWMDRNLIDRTVSGVADGAAGLGNKLRNLQGGKIQRYLGIALGLFLVLMLLLVYLVMTS